MKKILFAMVAFVAISFTACGNKTQAAGEVDSDSVVVDSFEVVDTLVTDSLSIDTLLAE